MQKERVSVIVPVYNREKTLDKCVDSILSQTYHNIEAVLIDDGSSDNSYEVIQKLVETHDNVIGFRQENMGAAIARRTGVAKATGEYVFFLDSDDWMPEDAIEKLYEKLKKYDLDYVKGNFILYVSLEKKIILNHNETGFYNGIDFLEHIISDEKNLIPNTASLSKRSLWTEECFPTYRNMPSEDYYTSINMAFNVKKAAIFNDLPVYYYWFNPTSLTQSGCFLSNQDGWRLYFAELRERFAQKGVLEKFDKYLQKMEIHEFVFFIRPINKKDSWYKSVTKNNVKEFGRKVRIEKFLVKHPFLCVNAINLHRFIQKTLKGVHRV